MDKVKNDQNFRTYKNFDLGTPCIENSESKQPEYKSQRHKSCMMNRQIRVTKFIGTVKCVVTCDAIKI